jgi:hypothetical protein
LPGLHGTGELFERFLAEFDSQTQIVELPDNINQDVKTLADYVSKRLPDDSLMILAESFSGSLIPSILNHSPNRIIGIIFLASFISCPNSASWSRSVQQKHRSASSPS